MNHWRVTYATEPSTVTDNWHRISRRSGTLGLYYTSISSISIDSNHSLTQSVHMCTIYELVVWGTVIHPTLGDNLLKYVFFFQFIFHFGANSCSGCDTLFPSLMLLEHHKEEFEHWSDDEDDANRPPCCRRNRDDDYTDTDSFTSDAESEDLERLL